VGPVGVIGSMVVKLIADAQQFEKQMNTSIRTMRGMERQFERSARRLEDMGRSMTMSITVPMALIGGSAIKMAMDAVEAQNLFSVTMGDMAGAAEQFSQRLTEQFGLATDAVNQQQAAFYRHFKLYQIGKNEALSMAQGLSMLTNDLGSFINMDPSEVLQRLQSGLRGETDAVEALGISLADSIVKQTAYKNGLARQGQELTEQQKQMARYMAIMQQTADAQGDLARTIESPANQMRIMKQEMVEANKEFGEGLLPFVQEALPVLRQMAGALKSAATAFQQLSPGVKEAVVWTGLMAMAAGPLVYMLGMINRGAAGVMGAIGGVARFARDAAKRVGQLQAGTKTLGNVMVAIAGGKLKLIMAALVGVALVALLVITHWKQVEAAAVRIWNGISAVVLYAASLIVRGVSAIMGAVAWIVPALRPAVDAVQGWADSLKGAAGAALTAARTAQAVQDNGEAARKAAEGAKKAAQNQQKLGESMDETAKAAGDGLQSFDQVHQVQEQMAESPAATIPEPATLGMDMSGMLGALGFADLGEQMTAIGDSIAQGWAAVTASVAASWESMKAKAVETFPWLQGVIDGLSTALQYCRDNWATIGPVVESVTGVLLLAGAAFLVVTSPVWAVIAAVAALAVAAGWIIANWETVGPYLTGIWESIVGFAGPIFTALGTALAEIWNGIVDTAVVVWGYLKEWWAGWGDTVMAVLTGIWNAIRTIVETAINLVREIIGFVLAVIRGDWAAAWNYVKQIVKTLWDFLVRMFTIIWETIVAIWKSLQDNIAGVWDAIKAKAEEIWNALVAWLKGIWDGIKNTVIEVWTSIRDSISEWWNNVKSATEEVWNALVGWLGGIWDGIKNTVVNVWTAIRDSISEWWGNVKTATEEKWNALVGWLSGIWEGIKGSAASIWEGITGTIGEWVDSAQASIERVWNSIAGTLESIWNGIKSTAATIWDGIVNAIKTPINWAIGLINKFLDALSKIKIKIPEINIPLVGKVGGGTIGMPNIPRIPMLAAGGDILRPGAAVVGEAGAELLELPRGARVTPLSGGGGDDLVAAIAQAVFAAVRQAMQSSQQNAGERELIFEIDGQRFARIILPALTREGGRIGSPVLRIQEV